MENQLRDPDQLSMAEARKLYKQLIKEAADMQSCACGCGVVNDKRNMHPHHIQGRRSPEALVSFVWVTPECHRRIHDHPAWAETHGLLKSNR